MRAWDVGTRKPIGPAKQVRFTEDSDVDYLAVSPDGKRLVTIVPHFFSKDEGAVAQLWELPDGNPIGEPLPIRGLVGNPIGEPLPIRGLVVFSPDSC